MICIKVKSGQGTNFFLIEKGKVRPQLMTEKKSQK
jgi:hypothetical protein